MENLKELVENAKVKEIHQTVENGRQKYMCFTSFSNGLSPTWNMCVSDGVDMWRLELDEDELDAHRDLAGVNSADTFLSRFKTGFATGSLSLALIGTKMTLTVGSGAVALTFDLFEAKSADKKNEIQSVLFRLADMATSLDKKLSSANHTIETLRAQKGAAGAAFMDLGPKKGVNAAKAKPKKTGMSAINPTSKKRKTPQGVVFD